MKYTLIRLGKSKRWHIVSSLDELLHDLREADLHLGHVRDEPMARERREGLRGMRREEELALDDFDERLAAQLEKRAAQLSLGRKRIFLEAARMLRSGWAGSSVCLWLEHELVLEEKVEAAQWAAVPDR